MAAAALHLTHLLGEVDSTLNDLGVGPYDHRRTMIDLWAGQTKADVILVEQSMCLAEDAQSAIPEWRTALAQALEESDEALRSTVKTILAEMQALK